MKRKIVLAIGRDRQNLDFLEDYFSDTRSECVIAAPENGVREFLKHRPEFLFADLKGLSRKACAELISGISRETEIVFGTNIPEDRAFPSVIALESPFEIRTFQKVVFAAAHFPDVLKVLTIDDDREICEGIKESLELRKGPAFRVESASNGFEGFRKIESCRPDVTILDIKMPVKNGLDLCREMRRKNPELRMIVLTSTVGADEILELRKSGVPSFVEKGSSGSSYPELVNLIKKQWLFS